MTITRYCTLFRVGFWCSLDVMCEISNPAEFPFLIDHQVRFRLIDKYGERTEMGHSIITGQEGTAEVWDEDGDEFPNLDAAVRAHAEHLLRISVMPGRWMDTPPRYDTFNETVVSAFDRTRRAP